MIRQNSRSESKLQNDSTLRGKSLGSITDDSEISTNEIPEGFPNITDHEIPDFECSLVEWEINNAHKWEKTKEVKENNSCRHVVSALLYTCSFAAYTWI